MKPSSGKRLIPLATKVTAIVLLVILVNTMAIGIFSYTIHRDDTIKSNQERIMAIAKAAAMSIVPGDFRQALDTNEKDQHYMHLLKQFETVFAEEKLHYFYAGTFDPGASGDETAMIMYIEGHGELFGLNGEVRSTIFRQEARDAFIEGKTVVTEVYDLNVDGVPGVAAYAPVFDEDHKPIGLVGVIMSLEEAIAKSNNFALTMLIISLLIFIVITWIPVLYIRRSVAKPLSSLQVASNKITTGEMDVNLSIWQSNDEVGLLSQNFSTMQNIVIGMQNDINTILDNALNGSLSYRADSDKYPGEWRELISKFNSLMNTIAHPIDDVAETLSKIANGNFNARITSEYKGDFDRMKRSVNSTAIDLDKYLTEKETAENDAYKAELAKGQAEAVAGAMLESARYANKIQQNMLPTFTMFEEAFSDHSVIWKPRDIVGGDFYWLKNLGESTILCVCDCTGHGTPGALLTMLVASTFETLISDEQHSDPACIVYMLDQRLSTVLNAKHDDIASMEINDGCDLAVLHIAQDGYITMAAGNLNVFTCDGEKVTRYKGQSLFVGEGRLSSKKDVEIINIPPNHDNKFYIASDGLSDQIGGEHKKQFGFKVLEQIILENHNEDQCTISGKIWDAFEEYRGDEPRRDDFELITFKL